MLGIISFIFGTLFGSFFSVCIYRLPKNISIIKGRSFCPHCNKIIFWYDNIPIISFFLLKGKCRNCKEKISLRYPLVELISGVLFLFLYLKFSNDFIFFIKYVFFFSLIIIVSFIDIDYHGIPAYLCFIGILFGIFFSIIETLYSFNIGFFDFWALPVIKTIRALIFGFGFTYVFKFFGDSFLELYLFLRKKDSIEGERESLGLGDVDFMGMVAVFLGIQATIFIFFLAPFFALIYGIFAIIFKRSHLIPYLPYLSLATVIVFFYKPQILKIFEMYF